MKQVLTAAAAAMALAAGGCATTMDGDADNAEERVEAALCDAGPALALVGEEATQQMGARILELTGARLLRWVPPRTAVTMDFRGDRVTVSYGDDRVIDRISCG